MPSLVFTRTGEFIQSPNAHRIGRITSYNVCYTKLLRVGVETGLGNALDYLNKGASFRITSYNVCYTKLLRLSFME